MKKYWIAFASVIVISFAVLGWVGVKIYQEAPPIPTKIISESGEIIADENFVSLGQNVWQAMGGMEVGSIWGHGSYVAPDWTADWLHREAVFILDKWSENEYGKKYGNLDSEIQASLKNRLQKLLKKNNFNKSTKVLTISDVRTEAFLANSSHYNKVFTEGKEEYSIPANALSNPVKLKKLNAFFFWTAWAAVTNRPDDNTTYTSNWPPDELIGNKPTSESVVWTGVSILLLLAGIGGMAFYYAAYRKEHENDIAPEHDPLIGAVTTPSQKAVVKYFWIVSALYLIQITMGIIVAHYGVEGNGFYGIPLADILPYSVARTWHIQLGIFWIATAWLGAGLYITPFVSGFEPKGQRLGVNILFGALLVVVLGSMVGQWLSIMGLLPDNFWFYFGHSGYEYIDLGRFFQIALFAGLLIWLFLMGRAIIPALKKKDENRHILTLFFISTIAIALFYGAALMYGKSTNLAVAEYWRWWVVHLWVEGFFEVFATVVIGFLFSKLGLVSLKTATKATTLSSTIFLSGGIIGTLHHLYFTGTPTYVLALGSVFSALEVVPLVFVGYEAWENYKISKSKPWVVNYKWPIFYFIAVAFWNLIGAGLFGFMINPPIALYYMQGLNTTPVHGHAALFGVYGMLGIGLMLFVLRAMNPTQNWNEKTMKYSFWAMNFGLFAMVTFSLLPVGLMQTWASVEFGYWYARSSEFLQSDLMDTLRWFRAFGDTIFGIGAVMLSLFIFKITMRKK